MRVKTFIVSMMETNGYIIFDEKTLDGIVVDPGDSEELFIEFIQKENINIKYIALTHTHFDHIAGVDGLKKATGADVIICDGEEIISENPTFNLSGVYDIPITLKADKILKDGENIEFGNLSAKVLKTPGHTPGGCCYYFENEGVLFSGDTLFYGSIGRTDFPNGSFSDLINGIKEKLMVLPDDTVVYCGHGPKTQIGFEKENNPYISSDSDIFN